MAGKADKAAAFLKNGGDKAKANGARLHSLAMDPEMQAKFKKVVDEGRNLYRAVTSPEAKEAYRHVAEIINKTRKKQPRP
jgi:hypothetical protein